MENLEQKAFFLEKEYTGKLSAISSDTPRKWGKMNAQQMVEHMSEYVRIASGRMPLNIITPEDVLSRMQHFLASEKPFRENTPNSLMPDEPEPVKRANMQEAIAELQDEINYFFEAYRSDAGKRIANPFFGMLDYDGQVQLLYKHATHHLRQFGIDA